jgi:hypothetical protein
MVHAFVACLLLLTAAFSGAAAADRRVALVVGVEDYKFAPKLVNAANDARAISGALRDLGFEVETLIDPDRQALEGGVRRLGQSAVGAEASLFFYAGHALEVGGRNWLLPTSAELKSSRDVRFETIDLDTVLEITSGSARVAMVFLDACRDNPFRARLSASTRSLPSGGLGQVNAGVGTLVAFATAPGMVAADGSGPNSPFTAALLRHIGKPGLEVRQILSEVRRDVREATGGLQVPWETSSLEGQFYFRPVAETPPPVAEVEPALRASSSMSEREAFDFAREINSVAGWDAFLASYPASPLSALARAGRDKAAGTAARLSPPAAEPVRIQPPALPPRAPPAESRTAAPPAAAQPANAAAAERRAFAAAQRRNSVPGWDRFLRSFPRGVLAPQAREARRNLAATPAPQRPEALRPQAPAPATARAERPSQQDLMTICSRKAATLVENRGSYNTPSGENLRTLFFDDCMRRGG